MSDTATAEKPSMLEFFEAEKAKAVDAAKAIVDQAQAEFRDLDDGEREEVKHHTTEAHKWNEKIRVEKENRALAESIAALMPTDVGGGPADLRSDAKPHSIGEFFTGSEGYKALMARGVSGQFTMSPITLPDFGAVAGIVTESVNNILQPQRVPGILTPAELPLGLTELFGTATIGAGNSIVVVKETVTTNAAAAVSEAAEKPASNIQFETDTATLAKIATVIKVSNEMLEDEAGIRAYLDNRLALFVRQEREDVFATQLLAQANQVADATDLAEGNNIFDGVLAGAVKVSRYGGLPADAVAMTFLDYATALTTKDENGQYYSGGPFQAPGTLLWGRYRIAICERLGDGNIVVGAFGQGGTVWRKGGVTVDATNSNEDDFLKNLVAIRAEERAVLYLQRPDAFCIVATTS